MKLTGNTVLITGGTSGIGRGLAEALHARGNQVIVTGRRQALLDELTARHPGMRVARLDMQDPGAIDELAARARRDFPALNILVNNAGITAHEDLRNGIDMKTVRSIIETNIMSVLHLTGALLPTLASQPQSAVITTTSGLAFMPMSTYPTYSATKAFLHSWLQSLRHQLRDTPVRVLELPPPYVQTEFGGPAQAVDPRAMPLKEYIAEVMDLLEDLKPHHAEILVKRVHPLRWAERDGTYDDIFAQLQQM